MDKEEKGSKKLERIKRVDDDAPLTVPMRVRQESDSRSQQILKQETTLQEIF